MHSHGAVIPAGDGMVFVPGYEAASAVLRDPGYLVPDGDFLEKFQPDWRDHPSLDPNSLLNLNGDLHARIRGLMSRQFTRRRVAELSRP